MLRTTLKLTSSPLTVPSAIGVSPPRPETVPVSLSPSTLRVKVVVMVPWGPCISADHLPETLSAANEETARRRLAATAVKNFDFINVCFLELVVTNPPLDEGPR